VTVGYSGTPLPAKLGIKPGHRVLLVGAPDDLLLEPLPDGVTLHRRAGHPPYDVGVVFCRDLRELATRWEPAHQAITPEGRLWVAWPKKASGVATDLDDNRVREHGLAHGRVDVKVCAIDATWSGQCFVVRLKDR
jgi:hypothetical protein